MARLTLAQVSKVFGHTLAVASITLEAEEGEFLALLGPSGCGKTTLLRLIAGFELPDAGVIRMGDVLYARSGYGIPPEERNLGMVFQSYALWPHLSVFENVAYGLRVRRISGSALRSQVMEALERVGLGELHQRRPDQLSGGQRQRVALARCLALRPNLVLLDEPLANLDIHLRESMQTELKRIQRESGATFLFVTHDQSEAMSLADRIAVMDQGKIQQVAKPEELYANPQTEMVASFIGKGSVIPALFLEYLSEGAGKVQVWGKAIKVTTPPGLTPGPCKLCLRSRDLALLNGPAPEGFPGRVRWVSYRGDGYLVGVSPEGQESDSVELRLEVESSPPSPGQRIWVQMKDGWVIPPSP